MVLGSLRFVSRNPSSPRGQWNPKRYEPATRINLLLTLQVPPP